jgi:hypothetical protein
LVIRNANAKLQTAAIGVSGAFTGPPSDVTGPAAIGTCSYGDSFSLQGDATFSAAALQKNRNRETLAYRSARVKGTPDRDHGFYDKAK